MNQIDLIRADDIRLSPSDASHYQINFNFRTKAFEASSSLKKKKGPSLQTTESQPGRGYKLNKTPHRDNLRPRSQNQIRRGSLRPEGEGAMTGAGGEGHKAMTSGVSRRQKKRIT